MNAINITQHTTERQWGAYTVLEEYANYKVKRIDVKVGEQISLQYHLHRSEHWVIVQGTALVVNGEQEFVLTTNQTTYIEKEMVHRVKNIGDNLLIFIEVQCGSYLGEDDIVRLQDNYGRV